MGIEPISEGNILYKEKTIFQTYSDRSHGKSTPTHLLPGMGLVLVPEGRGIFPELTVRENLEMGGLFCKKDKKRIEKESFLKYISGFSCF